LLVSLLLLLLATQQSRVVRLEGIEVLMQLLKKRKASSAEAYGQALKDLPHLLQVRVADN
jgi:hypothetical protein